MEDIHRDKQETFFHLIFGGSGGFVCIARQNLEDGKWYENYFDYPTQLPQLLSHIGQYSFGNNLWYCPNVLTTPKRDKANVKICPTAWADLDPCHPGVLLVPPTVALESSPGRYQALWRFEAPQMPVVAEAVSKRIAYGHAAQGADKTGWDLSQLLRVPFTPNYKYQEAAGGPPLVKVIIANGKSYTPEDFDVYPDPPLPLINPKTPLPTTALSGAEVLVAKKDSISPIAEVLINKEPQPHRRSDDLWRLEVSLFECGLTRNEVFAVARDSKCNKYQEDGRPDTELWRDVLRAEEYHKSLAPTRPNGPQFTDLLTKEERTMVAMNPTIIEDYAAYGSSISDASPQYHQAGIFVILSALLSGAIQVPTMHGTIPLNVWFMILADTTLTRKSTSMNLAVSILLDISPGAMLASDGSMEGLFHALSTRPNTPSLFQRDEVAGFLDALVRKDYQAGMMEVLSNLYDGSHQKRVLRRETFDVYKPRLIFYGAGIKSRVSEILTPSHVESGFLPRFVLITAASDPSKVRPEGPPTIETTTVREDLTERLRAIHAHYNGDRRVAIGGKITLAKKNWDAQLTPEAWDFYNEATDKMRKDAYESQKKVLLIPMYERLARSGMKCAVLLAATRKFEESLTVDKEDMVRAFYYVEDWRKHAFDIVDGLAKSPFETLADKIAVAVVEHPGITRAEIMVTYRLRSKDADEIFNTLEQRGNVVRKGQRGKAERLWPSWESD